MTFFNVNVQVYAPYAFTYVFTVRASSAATAAARAIREAMRSFPANRRRRIDYYSLRIKRAKV